MAVTTPNMNLIQPTIGVDTGLTWETDQNINAGTLDLHNHTSGNGVQIPPSGLNINASLNFQNQQAINLQATVFSQQTSLATLNSLFVETDGNLYFNPGYGGSSIKITSGGTVNATSSGITNGTASAAFSSGVLVVNSASNTPANIQAGSILLGNNVSASKFLTLSPPASMASNYTLTLPPVPASTSFVQLDTSGNITASIPISAGIALSNLATSLTPFLVPTGTVLMWVAVTPPTGYLSCQGAPVSRTTYATLFGIIGTAYGVGDGSTTFNLPDMRGMFPRGVNNFSGNDPDAASRTAVNGGNTGDNVGSFQSFAMQQHNHQIPNSANTNAGTGVAQATNAPVNNLTSNVNSGQSSSETRPINLYFNFIIKT